MAPSVKTGAGSAESVHFCAVFLQREGVLEPLAAHVARAGRFVGVLRLVRLQVRLRHEAAVAELTEVATPALVTLAVDLPAFLALERLVALLTYPYLGLRREGRCEIASIRPVAQAARFWLLLSGGTDINFRFGDCNLGSRRWNGHVVQEERGWNGGQAERRHL